MHMSKHTGSHFQLHKTETAKAKNMPGEVFGSSSDYEYGGPMVREEINRGRASRAGPCRVSSTLSVSICVVIVHNRDVIRHAEFDPSYSSC